MDPQATPTPELATDEDAVRAIPRQMVEAWNRGDCDGFAASFTDDADFLLFDGIHLEGRQAIVVFTRQQHDTVLKGARLEGEVRFLRFLSPELAVMYSVIRVVLPGQTRPSPSRDSMGTYVLRKRDGRWRTVAFTSSRRLSMERQSFLDQLDALPEESQRRVTELVAALKR